MQQGKETPCDLELAENKSPADFINFVPWACLQLETNFVIVVTKIYNDDEKQKGKAQILKAKDDAETVTDAENEDSTISQQPPINIKDMVIRIWAIFEGSNLVEIRFDKNPEIPAEVFRIISLVVRYHKFLTKLTIKSGLSGHVIYEISKLLPFSYITEICFDGCEKPEPNYYLLLRGGSNLSHLSLSRCSIDDDILRSIAEALHEPKPASKTLAALNLSSNYITDVGVTHLAIALRSNRCIMYLNLSNNMISDVGVDEILNVLLKFPLTTTESSEKKQRRLQYEKTKLNFIQNYLTSIKNDNLAIADKKSKRKQAIVETKETSEVTSKARLIAEVTLGEFIDPFNSKNTVTKNDHCYSLGNNYLTYLNVAYNNLTYNTLCKIQKVLEYQNLIDRKPKGLLNVVIEGNNMPKSCSEIYRINNILECSVQSIGAIGALSQMKRRKSTKKIW